MADYAGHPLHETRTLAMIEVFIVGGSVAGLSAGLLLGRCRRHVVICDSGRPRNRFSRHMHGFLSREGIPPSEFLQISREQLARFPSVQFHRALATSIARRGNEFAITTDDGARFRAQTVLLATGILDEIPDLPGIEDFYGRSVHHCPYCDGWEHQDEPIAIYGKGDAAAGLAEEMLIWSSDIVYFSDGATLSRSVRDKLERLGIDVVETKIVALRGAEGRLEFVELTNGDLCARQSMFFLSPQRQNCELAEKLGCELDAGFVICDGDAKTCIPGVYAAGNTSTGLQLAIVAAAEGAKAAHAINTELMARASRRS